ncbi:unnamed protein product [Urochloa decumbens]|uniref:GDSL esterase/lipase n=1 Tax=Urochloa decumbens TaxID=240449 RepID=A0ABC8XGH6_9POAL
MVQGGAVPALFVFGDSQTDVGNNNNNLVTPFRANFPHNDVDYPPGNLATGRFSNGYNLADFMGTKGLAITFGEQIERDYLSVYKRLVQKLGKAQATTHLASSIFAAGIGGNDIATRVLSDPTTTTTDQLLLISDQQFINLLSKSLKRKLQRLYELGMRKLFLVGTGPLGCYPLLRQRSLVAMECDAEANALSRQYNAAAVAILRDMSTRHPGLAVLLLGPIRGGFAEAKAACCGVGESAALLICMPANTLCANRTSHVFWDGGHLTEVTAEKLTGIAFNGSAPLVSPVNLKQLSAAP